MTLLRNVLIAVILAIISVTAFAQTEQYYYAFGSNSITLDAARTSYSSGREDPACSNLPEDPTWASINTDGDTYAIIFLLSSDITVSTACDTALAAQSIERKQYTTAIDASCYTACGDATCLCPLGAKCPVVNLEDDPNPCVSPSLCNDEVQLCQNPNRLDEIIVSFDRDHQTYINMNTFKGTIDVTFLVSVIMFGVGLQSANCVSTFDVEPVLSGRRSVTYYGDVSKCKSEDSLVQLMDEINDFPWEIVDIDDYTDELPPGVKAKKTNIKIDNVATATKYMFYPEECVVRDTFGDQYLCYSNDMPQCNITCPQFTECDPEQAEKYCGYAGCILQPDSDGMDTSSMVSPDVKSARQQQLNAAMKNLVQNNPQLSTLINSNLSLDLFQEDTTATYICGGIYNSSNISMLSMTMLVIMFSALLFNVIM